MRVGMCCKAGGEYGFYASHAYDMDANEKTLCGITIRPISSKGFVPMEDHGEQDIGTIYVSNSSNYNLRLPSCLRCARILTQRLKVIHK